MTPEASRLLEAIRRHAQGRKRLGIDAVWKAFRKVIRGFTGDGEARSKLAAILTELQEEDCVRLPKSARLWDASVVPPIPRWIYVVSHDEPRTEEPVDPAQIPWPPELAFAAKLSKNAPIAELLAIKLFLAEGGRARESVPLRERSLELFGDEKRLNSLLKSRLFSTGRLSLDLLRCHDVAPPLVWEPALHDATGPEVLLVIENLHTYESFRRWNVRSGAYRAIIYGHGSEFRGTVRDLPRLCALLDASRVEYFGDLDHEGLRIPVQSNRALQGMGSTLRLSPATGWYELLLECGTRVRGGRGGTHTDVMEDPIDWLPAHLQQPVATILEAGIRLPQEAVGSDLLSSLE